MADDEPKQKKPAAGAPAWMCTFADMMSLLLCFFVLILSFANMDEVKFAKMAGSMKDAFGSQQDIPQISAHGEQIISQEFRATPINVREEVQEAVEKLEATGMIETAETSEGIIIRVGEQLAFDSGRAEIKPEFLVLLNRLGKVLAAADSEVVVRGHTDNVALSPGSPFRSNWGLSTARSVAVVEHWINAFRIPASRLSAAGFADGKPIASNSTPEGRAQNRRVEFIIKPAKDGKIFTGFKEIQQENEEPKNEWPQSEGQVHAPHPARMTDGQ